MVNRQAEEAEKTAADIWEKLAGDDNRTLALTKEEVVNLISPTLLRWERDLVNPYIERILQLDGELNLVKASLKEKEAFLRECFKMKLCHRGEV